MRILKRAISGKDAAGYVSLLPEDAEDMWHIYNILSVGDELRATTVRKVVRESATGSVSSDKRKITLTLAVEEAQFDAETSMIRVKGRNVAENEHVKMGAYHTIDLELNKSFTISKKCWDMIHLERLTEASDVALKANVAAVVMSQSSAQVCLITNHMTIVRNTLEMNIPKKRAGSTGHEKAMQKFFNLSMQAMLRHVDLDHIKTIIIASPGFIKDDFHKYVMEEATRQNLATVLNNRSKFLTIHSSGGHKGSLNEVLRDPGVQKTLTELGATAEVDALAGFFEIMHTDPDRAMYGYKHVKFACDRSAIDTLLLTDELFRSSKISARRAYVKLVEDTRASGGKVHIFSSMHTSGEQLSQISGVAATLRFPLPAVDDMIAADSAAHVNATETEDDDFILTYDSESSSSSDSDGE